LVVDGAITASKLAAESVTSETIRAGAVTGESLSGEVILGSRITTATEGKRVELDESGFRLYDADEDLRVELPTSPDLDPTFRGSVQADGLTVRQGATFYSPWNEFARDSVINLAEQVAGPVAGPVPTFVWDSVPLEKTKFAGQLGEFWLDPSEIVGAGRDFRGGATRVLIMQKRSGGTRIWFYDMSGALSNLFVDDVLQPFIDVPDFEVTGAYYTTSSSSGLTWFGRWADNGQWYFRVPGGSYVSYPANNPGSAIAMSWNGSEIAVVEKNTANTYRFRTVSIASNPATVVSGYIGTGTSVRDTRITFVYKGSADFGAEKYVVAHEDAAYRVYSSGSTQPERNWDPPTNVRRAAFWDAGTGRFYTIAGDGQMYTHESLTWTDSSLDTWYVGQSFYDANPTGGTHETALGSITSFTMKKRAKVRFTLAEVPTGSGGSDDPTHWRLYAKRGTAPATNRSDMYLQATGIATSKTATLSGAPVTSGTTALQFGTFENASPARVRSARTLASSPTLPVFEVRGDGSGRWGPLEFGSDGKFSSAYDTGWITIPAASGMTGTLQGRRIGNEVFIKGTTTPNTTWASATAKTIVSALPSTLQPPAGEQVKDLAMTASASADLILQIIVSGSTITAKASRDAGAVTGAVLNISYLTD
jgi:hypothetical protein